MSRDTQSKLVLFDILEKFLNSVNFFDRYFDLYLGFFESLINFVVVSRELIFFWGGLGEEQSMQASNESNACMIHLATNDPIP